MKLQEIFNLEMQKMERAAISILLLENINYGIIYCIEVSSVSKNCQR